MIVGTFLRFVHADVIRHSIDTRPIPCDRRTDGQMDGELL